MQPASFLTINTACVKTPLMAVFTLLMSCSAHIPLEIQQPAVPELKLEQVQTNIDAYLSDNVRWGGIILETNNREQATWLTIMAQPLDGRGRPGTTDISHGRFIAIIAEFLEPKLYARDRQITVSGQVKSSEIRRIGEFDYNYPVIEVRSHYLWPELLPDYPIDPFWYHDPWRYPYYPYYPYYSPAIVR